MFRPLQTTENATRHQEEVVKKFEKEKAVAALRNEVAVSRGWKNEANGSGKKGGEVKEENNEADRGVGDGDLDGVDEGGPEAGGNDSEEKVLENKGEMR